MKVKKSWRKRGKPEFNASDDKYNFACEMRIYNALACCCRNVERNVRRGRQSDRFRIFLKDNSLIMSIIN